MLEERVSELFTAAESRESPKDEVMVRTVVCEVEPLGTTEDGLKRQDAPEGRPPVQAKVIVERKPPDGVAVSVTGFDTLPRTAVVEAAEGVRVNDPTGLKDSQV